MGGIRAVVIGGFNEHSAEVHRFIENAATAGASRGTGAEGTVADVQAQLRKQFRQQMSIGAWKDLHTHILRRVAHINPTPAAEAKMLREKMDQNRCFREKRVAVARRRLDEGEALGGRATAGRGRASGENSGSNHIRRLTEPMVLDTTKWRPESKKMRTCEACRADHSS